MIKSQQVLAALALAIKGDDVVVDRNATLPSTIPDSGLVILRDGDPGPGEPQMSPVAWLYEHQASLEVVAAGADDDERRGKIDTLLTEIGLRIAADRTLGGLCDYVEAQAPVTSDIVADEGTQPIKAVSVPVILSYVTSDPLA